MDVIGSCDPCSFYLHELTIARLLRRPPNFEQPPVEVPSRIEFHDFDPSGSYNVTPAYNSQQVVNNTKMNLSLSKNSLLKQHWMAFKKNPPKKFLNLVVVGYEPR